MPLVDDGVIFHEYLRKVWTWAFVEKERGLLVGLGGYLLDTSYARTTTMT